MAGFQKAMSACAELKTAIGAGKLGKCEALLRDAKVALTELSLFESSGAGNAKEVMLAREVLELGAQWSIKSGDVTSFEMYIAQLKTYYFDLGEGVPESPFMYELLGANLLCLLSSNLIAEFHMELERFTAEEIHTNVYLKHPVTLEQFIMEGAYNKVFLSKSNVPSDLFVFFVDILMETVREEIADCCEAAYDALPKAAAARVLFLEDAAGLAECVPPDPLLLRRPTNQPHRLIGKRNWAVDGDIITFPEAQGEAEAIAPETLIERTLGYASELEKIV